MTCKTYADIQVVDIPQILPKIHIYENITDFTKIIPSGFSKSGKMSKNYWYKDKKRVKYDNGKKVNTYFQYIPVSFDIETYTKAIYDENGKIETAKAYMYVAQISINGNVIICRYWNDVIDVFNKISEIMKCGYRNGAIYACKILVHNLGYEFQFLRFLK